ncbi:MAG: helix-turn-helix domain-containing protein [Firmicutes bacterium]|nr:helix-turn-helix domain-containing protein [Bacillota bacterium]MDY5531910.1 helix-turn-helix domain-containing protein [Pumilibacteraceae bacterium]
MSVLSEKTEYLRRITGIDLRSENRIDKAEKATFTKFSVECNGQNRFLFVPKNTDKAIIALVRAYFSDTDRKNGSGDVETEVYRLISGVATPDEIVKLDKATENKKYFAELLVTADPEKWSELFSYLSALSTGQDYLVKCDLGSALYLKFCDGSYGTSEELAAVLYEGITSDRKIDLVICSGGFASGANGIMSAYSRTLAAYRLCFGKIRNYSDCALVDLMRKVPEKDLVDFLDYLSAQKEEYALSDTLKTTASEFLGNDLNVAETSKKMFLHRNTLQSRLDKIENLTGINLRSFRGAELFDLITSVKTALGEK